MTAHPANAVHQTADAYRRMTVEARYHPAAPSDGFGGITGPIDVDAQSLRYASSWLTEEDSLEYWVGCPGWPDRPALVFTIEAARLICGCAPEIAVVLLRMAADDLEARHAEVPA